MKAMLEFLKSPQTKITLNRLHCDTSEECVLVDESGLAVNEIAIRKDGRVILILQLREQKDLEA